MAFMNFMNRVGSIPANRRCQEQNGSGETPQPVLGQVSKLASPKSSLVGDEAMRIVHGSVSGGTCTLSLHAEAPQFERR